jgi:hypothetical protein
MVLKTGADLALGQLNQFGFILTAGFLHVDKRGLVCK